MVSVRLRPPTSVTRKLGWLGGEACKFEDVPPDSFREEDRHCVPDLFGDMCGTSVELVIVWEGLKGRRFAKGYGTILIWMCVTSVGDAVAPACERGCGPFPGHSSVNVCVTGMVGVMAGQLQALWPCPPAAAIGWCLPQPFQVDFLQSGRYVVGNIGMGFAGGDSWIPAYLLPDRRERGFVGSVGRGRKRGLMAAGREDQHCATSSRKRSPL